MSFSSDWLCSKCGYKCFSSRNSCPKCNTNRDFFIKRSGDWTCPQCHDVNFASRSKCRKCDKPKILGDAAQILSRPGDWNCKLCKELNFANRIVCRKCNQPKDSSTKSTTSATNATNSTASEEHRDTENICKICESEPTNVQLPCKHVGMCLKCALSVDKCPFCRTPYDESQITTVYIV